MTHRSVDSVPPVEDPTPRPDRISRDYSKEYPAVVVESRLVVNQTARDSSVSPRKNFDNVKLNDEVRLIAIFCVDIGYSLHDIIVLLYNNNNCYGVLLFFKYCIIVKVDNLLMTHLLKITHNYKNCTFYQFMSLVLVAVIF